MTLHVLIIDNYDSFTYNLVQYLGEQGAKLTIWRNDQFTLSDIEQLAPDAILVSPGPCTPSEAGLSVEVIKHFAPTLPILGVCLGHQSIGQAFGATVKRAPVAVHGKTSPLKHSGTGLFKDLADGIEVARYHSLIVDHLPVELMPTAWACDHTAAGEQRLVMALQHRDYPTYGLQFHPESIATQGGKQMISNFLAAVRAYRGSHA